MITLFFSFSPSLRLSAEDEFQGQVPLEPGSAVKKKIEEGRMRGEGKKKKKRPPLPTRNIDKREKEKRREGIIRELNPQSMSNAFANQYQPSPTPRFTISDLAKMWPPKESNPPRQIKKKKTNRPPHPTHQIRHIATHPAQDPQVKNKERQMKERTTKYTHQSLSQTVQDSFSLVLFMEYAKKGR